uniref:C2 domain-containing protein n=1 Tax=Kalanchoe fedtschenkoi TaxID=63787 RepID=A0A7N0T204_KALFE
MTQRILEINVAHAQDLKDVNLFTKMDVYVVVSIVGGDNKSRQKTNVDRDSGTHPTWNFPMKFPIDELSALQGRLTLVFKLKCEGSLTDADIGEVHVPLKDLLTSSSASREAESGKYVHYQVTKPSGKGQGMLTFSYKFGNKICGAQTIEPVKMAGEVMQPVAYSPPQQQMGASWSYCVPSGQDTYTPSSYPQPPKPYPYPPPPEQVSGFGYMDIYPPPPAPKQYPPPPQATGSPYPYPPSPGPTYAYSPFQQPPDVYPPPPSPFPSAEGNLYPQQQRSVYPYPPQPEPRYGYPPQAYPGFVYPPKGF